MNYQEYKVMFLTGCNTISYKTLQKLKAFYESGGTIISTTKLPHKSAELGEDQKVIVLIQDIFGINSLTQDTSKIHKNSNKKGGKAIFIPKPSKLNIEIALAEILPDVRFVPNPQLATDFGKFSYIHKIKDGIDIYFFANSSSEKIVTDVLIRGKMNLEIWDPHSGKIRRVNSDNLQKEGHDFTQFSIELEPVSSVFYISKE